MKKVNLFLLFFILWGVTLHAADDDFPLPSSFEETPICMHSSLLPGIVSDALFHDCFSVDVATTLASKPDKLYKYLDKFPLTRVTAPFHYWYHLRKDNIFRAFLYSVAIINAATDFEIVERYKGDGDFLLSRASTQLAELNDNDFVRLLNQQAVFSEDVLEPLFLLTLDVLLKRKDIPHEKFSERTLAHAFYRMGVRLTENKFGCSKSSDCTLIGELVKQSKRKIMFPYLDFYLFFLKKGGIAPSFTVWQKIYRNRVVFNKKSLSSSKPKKDSPHTLLPRIAINQVYRLPKILLKDKKDLNNGGPHVEANDFECAYLKERDSIFQGDRMGSAKRYNQSLQLVSGCAKFQEMPVSFGKNHLSVDREEMWIIDAALMLHLVMTTPGLTEKRDSLMLAALYVSAEKYGKNRTGNLFGEALLYAYSTRNLSGFMNARFFAPAALLSAEEMSEAVGFVERFYE